MNEQTPTILFVDDEQAVLRAMQRLFRRSQVRVLTAASAQHALAVLDDEQVHVVVADQRMPGGDGTELLRTVRDRYPDTVRCILSGYAEMHAVVAAINEGNVYRFIAKPWDDEELTAVIHECIAQAQLNIYRYAENDRLEKRAIDLDRQASEYQRLLDMQRELLSASREVLDHLPVAVASIDEEGRLIYSNRQFSEEFGTQDGTTLGQLSGDPWLTIANSDDDHHEINEPSGTAKRVAYINKVQIGGQRHTLIAVPN